MAVHISRLDGDSRMYEVEIAGPLTVDVRRLDLRTLLSRSPALAAAAARSPLRFSVQAPALTADGLDALSRWLEADTRNEGAALHLALRGLWHAALVEARNSEDVRREALELRRLLTPERREADGSVRRALSRDKQARLDAAESAERTRSEARARSALAPLAAPVHAACARWRGLLFRHAGGSPAELARVAVDLDLPSLRLLCIGYMAAHCQPEPAVLCWIGSSLTPLAAAEVHRAAFPARDARGGAMDDEEGIAGAAALLFRLGLKPALECLPRGAELSGGATAARVRERQAACADARSQHLAREHDALEAQEAKRLAARDVETRARARRLARRAGSAWTLSGGPRQTSGAGGGSAARQTQTSAVERAGLPRGSVYRKLVGQLSSKPRPYA